MGEYGGAVKEHWLLEGEAISGYKNEQWLDKKHKNINLLVLIGFVKSAILKICYLAQTLRKLTTMTSKALKCV